MTGKQKAYHRHFCAKVSFLCFLIKNQIDIWFYVKSSSIKACLKAVREFILEAEDINWIESISGEEEKNAVNYGLNFLIKSGEKCCAFLSSTFFHGTSYVHLLQKKNKQ